MRLSFFALIGTDCLRAGLIPIGPRSWGVSFDILERHHRTALSPFDHPYFRFCVDTIRCAAGGKTIDR